MIKPDQNLDQKRILSNFYFQRADETVMHHLQEMVHNMNQIFLVNVVQFGEAVDVFHLPILQMAWVRQKSAGTVDSPAVIIEFIIKKTS